MMAVVTPTDVRAVLARYPILSPWTLAGTALERPGFSGAGVSRVASNLGPVAVRRWPAGWPVERLRGLHRLLQQLRESGVDFVAVPLRAESGETLVDIADAWWQIEPWLPGNADYHQHPSPARLTATMQALAKWHQAAMRFVPTTTEAKWFAPPDIGPCPAIHERLERILSLSPQQLEHWHETARRQSPAELQALLGCLALGVQAGLTRITAELREARDWSVPRQICLRDVWHDHLLFTDDRVTGLIDPSAARTDSVAGDLARLLGSLVEDRRDDWGRALDAYQRLRPLSLAEQRLIPVLDRSGVILSAATWLQWLGPESRPGLRLDLVIDRLQRLAGRLQQMTHGD